MTKMNKHIKKRAVSKINKGKNKGQHFSEGQQKSKFPHMQPKPRWVKPTGKHGWWSGKKVTGEAIA
jgi:hypothetical protein